MSLELPVRDSFAHFTTLIRMPSFEFVSGDISRCGHKYPSQLGSKPALEESAVYYAYLSILNANVRYIILSGSNEFVGNLLVFLGRYGLVRAGYVYMSYNDPTASLDKHPELMDYMDGFVLIQGDAGDLINDRVQSVHNAFNARLNMDMRIEDFVGLFELPMAFDCVMIMLTGFHRLFQQHGPDLLTQGKLQSLMNHSLFEDVGYDGLMSTHMKLNKNGDLLMPFQLMIYDANEGMVAFGMTDIEASYVTYYENGQLTFNGGLTTPPWDGSYRVFELPVVSVIRTRLLALFCVGVVFCSLGLMGLILLRNNPVIKRASVAHNLLFTCACFISYLKLLFYSFNPSPSRCYNLWWPFPISSSIIMVSLICKNQVLSILADSPKRVKGPSTCSKVFPGDSDFILCMHLFGCCMGNNDTCKNQASHNKLWILLSMCFWKQYNLKLVGALCNLYLLFFISPCRHSSPNVYRKEV
ncbi:hypothetical protein BCR33DRAFT_767354 [Rhizoclosmatium globosum]|uniref:G-protein coupled receptors family 3 profile domain-containing protein n=1 Tax=Rhizoclosmatium globosum TaxID=329046 RepID=A0A1Y2C4R2_9FUNG|nr:hypothetical protein BCR33DRAFT_767354 [Rhizoclosmatium globosum]|eukprot:ORY42023.1 hypothetical protein BCR33DRAFT_767354 [Rhizoclosmatium globosum]